MNSALVLGSGPAAAAAAIWAAMIGLDVTAFAPRSKASPGETLHPGLEILFRQLGVWDAVNAQRFTRFERINVDWAGQTRSEAFGESEGQPWQGFHAPREQLDAVLWARANELGVHRVDAQGDGIEIVDGRIPTVRMRGESWRVVIDGTGRSRVLAAALGLRVDRVSPPLVARYGYLSGAPDPQDPTPSLVSTGSGWRWSAPIGAGTLAWVNLELNGTTSAEPPVASAHLRPIGKSRGADVGWCTLPECAGRGYFVAGDAAVVLDPCSGHGVLRALMSGIFAAHLAATVVREPTRWDDATATYRDWLQNWFLTDASQLAGLYSQLPACPDWVRDLDSLFAALQGKPAPPTAPAATISPGGRALH